MQVAADHLRVPSATSAKSRRLPRAPVARDDDLRQQVAGFLAQIRAVYAGNRIGASYTSSSVYGAMVSSVQIHRHPVTGVQGSQHVDQIGYSLAGTQS
jgi:hypothetical protein